MPSLSLITACLGLIPQMNVPHPSCVSRPGAMDPIVWGVWIRPDERSLAARPASQQATTSTLTSLANRVTGYVYGEGLAGPVSKQADHANISWKRNVYCCESSRLSYLTFFPSLSLSVSAEPRLVSSLSFWRVPLLRSLRTSALSEPLSLFLFSPSGPLAVCLRDLAQHLKQLREASKGLSKCSARTYTCVMHKSWSSPTA